ncbi:unnamed protein product [Mucor hiemalis]
MQEEVYVSGYTSAESEGIYRYSFDTETGVLTLKGLAAKLFIPLTLHCIRVVDYKGEKTGYVSAYYRNKETGELKLINEQPSGGEHPCHAVCDSTGNFLLVANYTGGSAAVFPILSPGAPESSLGEAVSNPIHSESYKNTSGVPDRQEKPHVHSIDLDPIAQQYVFTNDLGCDLLVTYKFDRKPSQGTLTPHSTLEFPTGSGPRHLKFAPNNNNFCYVVTELSNDIYMLEFNFHEGKFNQVQKIHALPEDFEGENLGSEIDISPNGKFLYTSMRGLDAITIFKIDEFSGKLSLVGFQNTGGKHPRHFTIDPTGSYLLVGNAESNTIVVFKIDAEKGTLTQVSSVEHSEPTCIQFWSQ